MSDVDLNARPLIEDELPAAPSYLHEDAQNTLRTVVPLYEAVSDPSWRVFAAHLAGLEQDATEKMITTADSGMFVVWQTRVKLLREFQELPATLAAAIRDAHATLNTEGI